MDKIGFLRKTSGQFGKFVQLPTVILKRASVLFCNGARCCSRDLGFSFINENVAFRKMQLFKNLLYGDGPQASQALGPSLTTHYMTLSPFLDL